jgi:hypothetical protein
VHYIGQCSFSSADVTVAAPIISSAGPAIARKDISLTLQD